MNTCKHWLCLFAFLMVATLSAQTITGTVIDGELKEPLLGANVLIKGTSHGTSTDENGKFTLKTTQKKGTLEVSFIGFKTQDVPFTIVKGKASIQITLLPDAQELTGTTVIGNTLMDIAKERKTPVAVSTIRAADIVNKIGNQEFPELLNKTPSVHATKSGGGYGDSKINIRGFGNENIAVMINGMPINDMENGKVYWSNWAGISDVTSSMQVQRGLGASKIAIASVGGTINIVTRASDMQEGGTVSASLGNNGFYKVMGAYNTGKSKKGWSSSVLLSRTAGATYVNSTDFESYNYFFALGYTPNEKHSFQFMFTGAPQWHHQRSTHITIADYLKYGEDGKPNLRYNSDWGNYKGSEFNFRRNVYHKPVMMLNWDWNIDEQSSISTVAYASFGRGAGTRDAGSAWTGSFQQDGRPTTLTASNFRTEDGQIDMERIINYNRGEDVSTPNQTVAVHGTPYVANAYRRVTMPNGRTTGVTEGFARKAAVNSHNWFGFLTSFNHKLSEKFSFSVGLDGRYYKGYHYEVPSNLLGAEYFQDNSNKNLTSPRNISYTLSDKPSFNPFGGSIESLDNQITFSNDGNVRWLGAFGQVEYTTQKLSAFAQWSSSIQAFQRIDHFLKPGTLALKNRPKTAQPETTTYKSIPGYNMKAGANYNIDEHHNVFVNVGYYSRQPFFNSVYPNYKNFVNPNLTNEKILGLELGYGFRWQSISANLNVYRTSWKDRYVRRDNWDGNTRYFAEMLGVTEIHQGVELDAAYRINDYVKVNGMFSLGDWFYQGGARVNTFLTEDNSEYILSGKSSSQFDVDLDKLKVGESAQMTANLGVVVTPYENFNIDLSWHYVNNLYARLDITSLVRSSQISSLKLPQYNLFEGGASYKFVFGKKQKQAVTVLANVNNILDTTYISESDTNQVVDNSTRDTYKGIDVRNRVFFGFGRTWNVGLKYQF